LDQTAITDPYTTVTNMSGEMIKTILEDVADNLFNPDPYYQQGGDMVRVGGMQYTIDPAQSAGNRITDMRLNGKAIEAGKTYKVAGWAPVSEEAKMLVESQYGMLLSVIYVMSKWSRLLSSMSQ
jgi:sulfur-oxidizing protein SoxB